jgi:hypothetical protein
MSVERRKGKTVIRLRRIMRMSTRLKTGEQEARVGDEG